jgi:hypothetical protein
MRFGHHLLNNKAFVFGQHPETYESEKQIILELCTKNALTNCKNIHYVDSNANYDLFFADCSEGSVAVKLSLDLDYPLEKEFEILKTNLNRKISPFPIDCGKKNNVNYSILAQFPFQNLDEMGRAEIVSSDDSVPYFLANLSSFKTKQALPYAKDYINQYLNFDIYKIPEAQIEWIHNHKVVQALIKEQIFYLQKIVKEKLEKLPLKNDRFCHGNLTSSNILTDGINLFAINFENAYWGDDALQFALLKHEMFYDDYRDRILYEKYCGLVGDKYDASSYFQYQTFASYFSLLQTLIDYINEVYVLKCYRQNRVMQNVIKFLKNYDSFTVLPDYQQKLKPIADFFLESVK